MASKVDLKFCIIFLLLFDPVSCVTFAKLQNFKIFYSEKTSWQAMGLITNQNLKQKLKKLSITDQVSELSLACHGVFSLKTFLHASRARNCERKTLVRR